MSEPLGQRALVSWLLPSPPSFPSNPKTAMSLITHITSTSQLDSLIAAKADKLIIIDFHATWCGPCHAIAPVYEKLSTQYRQVTFTKCDVDAAKEVAARYKISAMPTFILLRGGNSVDVIKGANASAIEGALKRHTGGAGGAAGTFPGAGHTLSGSTATTPAGGQSNFPDIRLILTVLAFVALWYYYGQKGEAYVPDLKEGLY